MGTIILILMVYSKKIIDEAKKLRARGKTYSEIKKELEISVPKSTLSSWCQKITLPDWYIKKVETLNHKNLSKGRAIALVSNALKHEKLLLFLKEKNKNISEKVKDPDVLKAILSILYLGEGSKWKSHRGLNLGSSDPNIIKLYIKLLHLCYSITPSVLKCRVGFRADQNIKQLQKYWSRISGISLKNFYKTISDPRTVGKPTKNKDYKGVCVISCGGTDKQLELELIPKMILGGL